MGFNLVEKLLAMTLLGTEWVLWLLVVLSIVSVAIILERFMFFRKIAIDLPDFTERLSQAVADHNVQKARQMAEASPALAAQVVLRGLDQVDKGSRTMEERMTGYLIAQRQNLDRGLMVLGTLGNNAPFIGLFGTVLGIIIAFHDLAKNPAGGPAVVMSGISEALIATAVGLIVAIPAVVFFNIFQRQVKRHLAGAEAVSKLVLSFSEKK